MTVGSCAYVVDTTLKSDKRFPKFGDKYYIYDRIAAKKPDYMFWLGDNIYLRNGDWRAKESVLARYTQSRQRPELNRLLRTGHHVAIWDDHDFGPNDSHSGWGGQDYTLEAFNLFWGNPKSIDSAGIFTNYRIGDVELFLTDCRFFRSPAKTGGGLLS